MDKALSIKSNLEQPIQKDNQTKVRNFVAIFEYKIIKDPIVNAEDDILNPMGIIITNYNVSERKVIENEAE